MAFLFGRSREKSAVDVVRTTRDLLQRFHSISLQNTPAVEKVANDTGRNLALMKVMLQGTTEVEPNPEQVLQVVELILQEDVLRELILNVKLLHFEARKDAQVVLTNVLRYKRPGDLAGEPIAIHYIVKDDPGLVRQFCLGYNARESAFPCGAALREALKYDAITALVLYDEPTDDGRPRDLDRIDPTVPTSEEGIFWNFFNWIHQREFEVSADAFNTFRDILTIHKQLVATYLQTNFETFFHKYHTAFIQQGSYVTKRQGLRLLGEVLLDRANYNVMTRYVQSAEFLKIFMTLLRDYRKMIQYESFHIFKIFIANPTKSPEVERLLINNKARMLKFLPTFLDDRRDDDQFLDERTFLLWQVNQLPDTYV
ncbi:Mo25-like protein [Lineolata rhizophorae]|uniref:Mo25-like protein n=1 Tax=Lineolata rhizophorae TaxID=578093 RepID=A0A6A6NU17_9PEZI|nr:Mo25-like protein [Lineolata rhizophorae]